MTLRRMMARPLMAILLLIGVAGCTAPPPTIPKPNDEWPVMPKRISGGMPIYPSAMMKQGIEGDGVVDCLLMADGTAQDCHIVSGTTPELAQAVLDCVTRSRYEPALHDGVPVAERRRWRMTFRMEGGAEWNERWKPVHAEPLVYPPGLRAKGVEGNVVVDCAVTVDGTTHSCRTLRSTDPVFEAAALDYIAHAVYRPVLRDGTPIEIRHEWTISFRLSAAVDVECDIDEAGVASNCVVTRNTGGPDFAAAALEHMARAKYKPLAKDGTPARSRHKWTLTFTLQDGKPVPAAN